MSRHLRPPFSFAVGPANARRRRAFTIVEMLVVMSLITLLVAMLLPAYGKAREAGRQSQCLSNVHQLGIAWQNYTTEFGGGIFDYTLNRQDGKLWTTVMQAYYGGNPAVLICPSTQDPPGNSGLGNTGIAGVRMGNARLVWVEARPGYNAPDPFNRSSYCYNGNMFAKSVYNTAENRYPKTTVIRDAGRTPILGDGIWRSATPGVAGAAKRFPPNLSDPQSTAGPSDDGVYRWVTNRHGDVSHIAFADSHAEAVGLSQMWSLQWHRNYVTVPTFP